MKKVKIVKTAEGYILHHCSFFKAVMTLCLLLMLSLAALPWVLFAIHGLPDDTGTLLLALVCSVGLGVVGGYFFYMAFAQRVIVNRDGVRLCHFGHCKREFLWRHVKSWGIACMKNHYSHRSKDQHYLYFSTKSGERLGKHCISMLIDPKEEGELRRSGLYGFISAHREEDENDDF